ncbi:MAG TPA: SUMF1/EgtB/PvdO family nonheme iron enzyme [Fibrobacteria bacterium]|nr:SUMF1/EgtB/PvdO family nonheme iron enzyme [Fibrobacteria bacterium]
MHYDKIRMKFAVLAISGFAFGAGEIALSGRIATRDGRPLPGVKVFLDRLADSAISNSEGAWSLSGNTNAVLRRTGIHGSPQRIGLLVSSGTISLRIGDRDASGRVLATTFAQQVPGGPASARTIPVADTLRFSLAGYIPLAVGLGSTVGILDTSLVLVDPPSMVRLRGGTFRMGSGGVPGATPHSVTIAPFSVDSFETTRAAFKTLMGRDPSSSSPPSCDRCPVESVSWYDALRYCNARSVLEGRPVAYDISDPDSTHWSWIPGSLGYRLPTEAEWEFAARGGSVDDFFWGGSFIDSASVSTYAWYSLNSQASTHPVGTRKANGYGLRDVSGNVWEWVWDWHKNLPSEAATDPLGPDGILDRIKKVIRGGSYTSINVEVAQTARFPSLPNTRFQDIGFRVVVGSAGR